MSNWGKKAEGILYVNDNLICYLSMYAKGFLSTNNYLSYFLSVCNEEHSRGMTDEEL